MPKTILTGLRANSHLHLGNYAGAILPMLKIQNNLEKEDEFYLFIPNLHSFTTPIDHSTLYDNTIENARTILAFGIDPARENVHLFRQSFVPAHSELAWILSCFSYFGEMQRMTQFKDKSATQGQNVGVGLFTYPILMAADILLYGSDYVPLGDDQRQHLELARDLAQRLNNKFAEQHPEGLFIAPKAWSEQLEFMNLQEGVRVRSLSNPESKMSKSVEDPKGTISLFDDPNEAAKKVMSATTDSFGEIRWDWKERPGITNLMQIHSLLTEQSVEQVRQIWEGQSRYGDLKKVVAESVSTLLSDFQSKYNQVGQSQVEAFLEAGEVNANFVANRTLLKVQKALGLK